ncbi:MAG: P-II family nitrogen regulator [Firmicutes bacterium]|nr:P-II family nitrogen regulator [Bacillota bacterium]
MKKVEAIIRPSRLDAVKSALNIVGIKGMTVTEVRGCGQQKGHVEYYRGSEFVVNLLPKVKVEVVIADDKLEEVITAIVDAAKTGEIGDGKIFIYEITDCVQVRTGQRGEAVI